MIIATMQQMIRIHAIIGRAKELGVPFTRLCRDAGVRPSTPYRWLKGNADPRLSKFDQTCARLEGALDRREKAMRDYLAPGVMQ